MEYEIRDIAETNIYFLYFSERNLNLDEDYADISVNTIRYNAEELFNKCNCFFINRDFKIPREIYL